MNRMTQLLTLGVAAIVALSFSTSVYATCPVSQPAQHLSGGKITNCPDAKPVAGFIGVVGSAATINSGNIDVICEDGSVFNPQGVQCQGEAGAPGDGLVTFSFDWGNPGPVNGCPNPTGQPNIGRNFFDIVCNNGASAILTVAYDTNSTGYPVDFAQPFNAADFTFDLNLVGATNGLTLVSFNRTGGQDTACIGQATQVPLYSDCDPGSAFTLAVGGVCLDTTPTIAPGANLYAFSGPGGNSPTDLRVASWGGGTPLATTAGPSGSKCVTYPTPATGSCTWIGSTVVLGGQDTGAISNWVQVCAGDPTAATDKVKIDSAAFKQGSLHVDFSTESESLIVGFNVYAGSTKLNTGLIAAKGTGSNAYSFEVGRSAVKSNKTVTVEAVKSDGTVVKTAPATLK